MTTLDWLSGALQVRPGIARPHSLVSTRPDWVGALTRGRSATVVPGLLAGVFSLCGHAHRLCAELALQAAAGGAEATEPAGPREPAAVTVTVADAGGGAGAGAGASRASDTEHTLQRETLREHVRRIGLDWPERLALAEARDTLVAQSHAALQGCPVFSEAGGSPIAHAAGPWLEHHLLGMPARPWLAAWQRDPAPWLAIWCETTTGWLPTLLRDCRPWADVPLAPAAPLRVHADETSLRQLAAHLRDDAGLARQPLWQGRCAETGTWTRLHDNTTLRCSTPWLRLGARIAELARLSLPDEAARSGAGWLASGALNIGPGEGLAWVEMARGLLVHHVQLDGVQASPRVAAYRVLAPTEWNFHPHGAVAAALETLPADDTRQVQRRVAALMAAYDPCVRFDVELQPCQPETDYA